MLYQKVSLLTGKQAGNPWLLELPDPVTRATWDNYAIISTAKARELGICTIGFAGGDGGRMKSSGLVDHCLIVVRLSNECGPALCVEVMENVFVRGCGEFL